MSAPILVIRIMTDRHSSRVATVDDPIEWMLFQDGLPLGPASTGRLGQIDHLLNDRVTLNQSRIVVLVPAEDVVLTRTTIPQNQKRQKDKLVPFILEEHLNQNISDIFFATEWLNKSNDVGVAYIDKARLTQWLDILETQGIKPDVVYPEHLLLPYQEGQCFAIFDRDRVFVRHDHWVASCAPIDFAEVWISKVVGDLHANLPADASGLRCSLLIDRNDQYALDVSADCEDHLKEMVEQMQSDYEALIVEEPDVPAPAPLQIKRLLVRQSVTYILALEAVRKVSEHQSFQLLQQDFKVAKRKRKSKYQWQKAAGFVLALLCVEMGFTASSYFAYENAYQGARVENNALFKKAFPHVTRIRGSLKRALSSELAKGGGSAQNAEFLNLVSMAGDSLRSAKGLVIQRMAFDASQGSLKVDLTVADYPDLEKIQKKIEAQSLQVKIDGANKDGNGVKARLRIDVS